MLIAPNGSRRYQKSTALLILKAAFERIIRSFIREVFNKYDWRIQPSALEALQDACEAYLTVFFESKLHLSSLLLRGL